MEVLPINSIRKSHILFFKMYYMESNTKNPNFVNLYFSNVHITTIINKYKELLTLQDVNYRNNQFFHHMKPDPIVHGITPTCENIDYLTFIVHYNFSNNTNKLESLVNFIYMIHFFISPTYGISLYELDISTNKSNDKMGDIYELLMRTEQNIEHLYDKIIESNKNDNYDQMYSHINEITNINFYELYKDFRNYMTNDFLTKAFNPLRDFPIIIAFFDMLFLTTTTIKIPKQFIF